MTMRKMSTMRKDKALLLCSAIAIFLTVPAVVVADYYDDFTDDEWEGHPDPNVWDLDNPRWTFLNPLDLPVVVHEIVGDYKALRLYAEGVLVPVALHFATADDGIADANLSATYWDDMTDHYVLCRAYYPGNLTLDPNDPNDDKGRAIIFMNMNMANWTGFSFAMEFHNCAYLPVGDNRAWAPHQHYTQLATLQSIDGLWGVNIQRVWIDPNGIRDPGSLDPNTSDPNDTTWLEPPERQNTRDPNYDDTKWLGVNFDEWERNGFWMVAQWQSDPNYASGDPNGKFLKGAIWRGEKYDWDGTWLLDHELSDEYWEGTDTLEWYRGEGTTLVAAATQGHLFWGAGLPADVAYDDFEARSGIFTNTSRALTLKMKDCCDLDVDPDRLDDPNHDPNDLDELRRYTAGTALVLGAVVPCGNKAFKKWTVKGPNQSDDPNYLVIVDTNEVLYLTMDGDYSVKATCKCGGGGVEPFAGMVLLVLGLGVMVRRAAHS